MRGGAGGCVYEELYDMLCELGLGAAARPLCDLFADLAGEPMSLSQLQQEIRNVLRNHSGERLVDEVITRLIAHGFAGLSRKSQDGEGAGETTPLGAAVRDSALLSGTLNTIVVEPC